MASCEIQNPKIVWFISIFPYHICPNLRYEVRYMIEGSLEVKLPTIWTDGKAEVGRVREEKRRREKIREEKKSEEWRCRWKGEEEKRRKREERVRSHLARWEMEKCTPLWRESHSEVKTLKTLHVRTTFRSWDVDKVHALVARNTFPSQTVQSISCPEHFWKLRCGKSARSCGAKHISKSNCAKHLMFGPLLEVEMSKECTQLWREAHFEVKSAKNWRVRSTVGSWDVEKMHVVFARSTLRSEHVQNTACSDHFWAFNRATLHDNDNDNYYYNYYYYYYYYYYYDYYYYFYY